MTRTYDYEHVVTFDETNVVGNVYFTNHLRWQGHCRELFLSERAPGVVSALGELALVTTRCSCEYFAELAALDRVVVQMSLAELGHSTITMRFDYLRVRAGDRDVVARGEQVIACLWRGPDGLAPIPVPAELRVALAPYATDMNTAGVA